MTQQDHISLAPSRPPLTLDYAWVSERGGRAENEDTAGVRVVGDALIAVVADGMGGGIDGKRFSELAVQTTLAQVDEDAEVSLARGVAAAAKALFELRNSDPHYERSGSTVVAAHLRASPSAAPALILNIGDSRAYQIGPNRTLVQLTRDHTYAEELIRGGAQPGDAYGDRQAHRLTHALGDDLRLDDVPSLAAKVILRPGDRLLLCSDGVSKALSADEIAAAAAGASTAKQAASLVVRRALERGARDNVTALVVICLPPARRRRVSLWVGGLVALVVAGAAAGIVLGRAPSEAAPPPPDMTVTPLPQRPSQTLPPSPTLAPGEPTATFGATNTPTNTPTPTPTNTPTPTRVPTPVPTRVSPFTSPGRQPQSPAQPGQPAAPQPAEPATAVPQPTETPPPTEAPPSPKVPPPAVEPVPSHVIPTPHPNELPTLVP